MTSIKRLVYMFLGVVFCSLLVSNFTAANPDQLRNDNGEFYAGSRTGRITGDIDGAVFSPDPALFPIVIQSVEFAFHVPQEDPAPWIGDSARVRVQIYAVEDGEVGEILAQSGPETFSGIDQWFSIPLPTPLTMNESAHFMAAVKWESGDNNERALSLALDSNLSAPQAEKDATNLYHREDQFAAEACRTGFCTHSQLGLVNQEGQSMGFNMIRVTVDSPPAPTATPGGPTLTPTSLPAATLTPIPPPPGIPDVYLPVISRNYIAFTQAVRVGDVAGEAASFALTSGVGVADRCWPGNGENNLWVGLEPANARGIMRSIIWFDLDGASSDDLLVKADLRLVAVDAGSDAQPMTVFVHHVTQPWPDCPTWNSLARATGQSWATVSVDSDVDLYSIDVTALVKRWLGGELPNYGLMLRSDEQGMDRFRGFVPTTSSQEDLRPSLILKYREP